MRARLQRLESRLDAWTIRVIRWMFPDLIPWMERKYNESNAEIVRLGGEPMPPLEWPGEQR